MDSSTLRRFLSATLLVGLPACFASCPFAEALPQPPAALRSVARFEPFASGLQMPVGLTFLPGQPEAGLLVVEKVGTVRRVVDGKVVEPPVIDLRAEVSKGGEQGLLGLAVHPRFAENRKIYVDYTDGKGTTRVVEWRLGNDLVVEPGSARPILSIDQPFPNHNAGHLLFGPDGKLWVATGDGGSAFDPQGHSQNDKSRLGKILLVDVDANPATVRTVAKGLRNPWRYAFDRATNDLFIADVGQNEWEWVHVVKGGKVDGVNFGWPIVEGSHCLSSGCDAKRFPRPVAEYSHKEGCSITGGIPYRGKAMPELAGLYLYSDFCTSLLRGFRYADGKAIEQSDWRAALDPEKRIVQPSAFGEDENGELYVTSLTGTILKLVRVP